MLIKNDKINITKPIRLCFLLTEKNSFKENIPYILIADFTANSSATSASHCATSSSLVALSYV